jgi:hypothetical protein
VGKLPHTVFFTLVIEHILLIIRNVNLHSCRYHHSSDLFAFIAITFVSPGATVVLMMLSHILSVMDFRARYLSMHFLVCLHCKNHSSFFINLNFS